MANVLNRTTKQFMQSVNEPDYPQTYWIWNPDLSAVSGFDSKYWIITGDTVTLMDQAARDAIEAAEETARRDAIVTNLLNNHDLLRAVSLRIIEEFYAHATRSNAIVASINNATTLDDAKTALVGLQPLTIPTVPELLGQVRAKIGVPI